MSVTPQRAADPPVVERPSDADRPLSAPAVTDALLWALLDAVPDGVLLVDGTGSVMLVNSHLEQMFGYDRVDLLGQPVELLIPEQAREAHATQRLDFAAAPRIRAMGVGLDLVGRHRDGSDIPIDIRLSPLPTATGACVIAAVREDAQRRAVEHHRVEASVGDESLRIARDLGDTVIRSLYGTGLRMHTIASQVGDGPREQMREVVGDLDAIIRDIRNVVLPLVRPAHNADDSS